MIDWRTLAPALLAQVNTFLMLMGVYHMSNDQVNAAVAVLSSVIGLIGIVISHKRKDSSSTPTTPPGNAP